MADFTPSFMCYGCHELINTKRTYTYVKWAQQNGLFETDGCCPEINNCGCDDDDTGFVDPITDNVCWYDQAIPASGEFLGMWIVGLTGLWDSPFSESVTDTVGRGVTIGRAKWGAKEAHFEAMALATSCRGMDYGLEYLRRTLETPDNGCRNPQVCATGGCSTREMTIRAFCPEPEDPDDGLRQFMNVGTIDGLKIIDQERRDKCCCTMRRVSFTLASERPESFSFQGTCIDDDASNEFTQCWDWDAPCDGNSIICNSCTTCGSIDFCGRVDCDACEQCSDCHYQATAFVPPPEPAQVIKDCYSYPLDWAVQCCCPDPSTQPTARDTTYRMEIFSGHLHDESLPAQPPQGLRDLRILIYDNPIGLDCKDASQEAYDSWKTIPPCGELHIKAIPPDTTLIIDGRTRTINAICKNVCVPAESLVFNACGGSVFPLVSSCTPKMICLEWALNSTNFPDYIFPPDVTGIPAHVKVDMYNVHR